MIRKISWCVVAVVLLTGIQVRAQEKGFWQSASDSAEVNASTSATTVVKERLRASEDFTKPEVSKGRLERALDSKTVDKLTPLNGLSWAIRQAVNRGVPANTIVLLILFPLVAALIAAARHIVGLQGFGIFTPAVISVAFLATGVVSGLLMFVGIILFATVARIILKKLKMPTMPRMALLLWFVTLGLLGLLLVSPYLNLESLLKLNIFPILLLILLAETFIDVQITRNLRDAVYLTIETLLLALLSFLVLSTQSLQEWVLLNPEIAVLGIGLTDWLIGKYSGLRLMEMWRFRKMLIE